MNRSENGGTTISPELKKAQNRLDLKKLGFSEGVDGWQKDVNGIGPVTFKKLSIADALRTVRMDTGEELTYPEFASYIQQQIFGMDDSNRMAPQHLNFLGAIGGSVFAAYESEKGFTPEGWVGVGFVTAGLDNTLFSLSLGVRDIHRNKGIGLDVRTLQAADAVNRGVTKMRWMQGARIPEIANLSFGTLKAKGVELAIDRVPDQKNPHLGPYGTDRIWAEWDLLSEDVLQAIEAANGGNREHPSPYDNDLAFVPRVARKNVKDIKRRKPPVVLYKILSQTDLSADQRKAEETRMRDVLPELLDSEWTVKKINEDGTETIETITTKGNYIIDGIAVDEGEDSNKTLFYVLRLKPEESSVAHRI